MLMEIKVKGLGCILFLLFVVMLAPSAMVAQNVGEWQEPCDGSVAILLFNLHYSK